MADEPTTWYSGPRPACATEAMIEAGARTLRRKHYPYMPIKTCRIIARDAINAALKASPKPPALPEPPATGDEAHE